jgi:hypothetical protein
MSTGGKKRVPSGSRANRRKKRGKKNATQIAPSVVAAGRNSGNAPADAGATTARAGEKAVCGAADHARVGTEIVRGPSADADAGTASAEAGDIHTHFAAPSADADAGITPAEEAILQYAAGPARFFLRIFLAATPPHTAGPDAGPRKLASGKAFLLAACACLLLLILESERAARRLDELAPDAAAETAASLLRAVGRASGAVRLGEWETSLINHLAGNTPAPRQTAPPAAEPEIPADRPESAGTPEAAEPRPETAASEQTDALPATAASEQADALAATAASEQTDALAATSTRSAPPRRASDGRQAAPEVPALSEYRTVSGQQTGNAPPPAPIAPPAGPTEYAGASVSPIPDAPALAGISVASIPKIPAPPGTGKERKTVLLVGDSMMGWGLGHTLERGMRTYPWISVKRYSQPSTGLCRNTSFDWPTYLRGLVAEHSPDLVVISIGANDGSTMVDPNRRACTVFTPAWEKEYLRRSEEFLHIAGSGGARVLWIGLPVAGVDKIEKVLRTVSRLQQDACAKYDFAAYLDIRTVLADKNGHYTSFRSGGNAAPVRIRAQDKVHVSAAGGKLLTDYIMPAVLQNLGRPPSGDAGDNLSRLSGNALARPADTVR